MSTVSTARCSDYNLRRVRSAVGECVSALPKLCTKLEEADRVLLKPNLLSTRSGPDEPVNTHPSMVQAAAEIVGQEFGCSVAIGDSCGSLSESSTNRAIENSGMEAVAGRTGADLYNVDQQPRETVAFPEGRIYREIPVPSNLDQFDLIISLAKLKTHHLTTITCAVKNLLGLVPGAGKKEAHLLAPRCDEFAALLCDLFAFLQPDAGLVDGIVGMEGAGPNNGDARPMEFLAASCDLFALDSVCARTMGLDPHAIGTLADGSSRGLGTIGPKEITIVGQPMESLVQPDFKVPPSATNSFLLRLCPRWLFRGVFDSMTSLYATIDQDACIRCGECARNCPSHAIEMNESTERYGVDPQKCICCYCCDEVCPADAIRMKRRFLGKVVDRIQGR